MRLRVSADGMMTRGAIRRSLQRAARPAHWMARLLGGVTVCRRGLTAPAQRRLSGLRELRSSNELLTCANR